MKKLFLLLLCLALLGGCTAPTPKEEKAATKSPYIAENPDDVRAIWLPYYDLQGFIKNKNEAAFTKKINEVFEELKGMGFNTVTVQVRPCADAFYRSALFPSSQYCFDKQGADMPYDPLAIMCAAAQKSGLELEAWVNPYRVSQSNKIEALSDDNIAKKWYQNKKTKSRVFVAKKKIFFNPASEEVIKLIVRGVEEIVKNYPVSAIHFDDYFYPVTDEAIDKNEYQKYQKNGGKLSLADYRRARVNTLIQRVYKAVKSINPAVRFGISPASSIKNNYNTLYADCEKWMSEEGFVDYICPQVYFGFRNVYQPFMFTVKKWMYLAKCDLYIGLPLYKAGKPDKYAATEDKAIINEFVNNDNILARQITYLSKLPNIKGFYVFSYGSLHDKACQKEVKNMIAAMQSSNH